MRYKAHSIRHGAPLVYEDKIRVQLSEITRKPIVLTNNRPPGINTTDDPGDREASLNGSSTRPQTDTHTKKTFPLIRSQTKADWFVACVPGPWGLTVALKLRREVRRAAGV